MTSAEKTLRHISRVGELLGAVAVEFIRRGQVHDRSKFDPEEAGPLAEMDALIAKEGNVPFGSPEYDARKALLGPMLAHHYAENSHHPEHYPDGVTGMDLFDLIEMLMDWKASNERDGESTLPLAPRCARYEMSDQLRAILQNTADRLGWAT